MRAFNYSKIKEQKWDSEILGYIAAIYKEAGKQELYLKQRPEELEHLVEIAKVQSTEASNAIEGIVTTSTRIKQLVEEKTTPRNRDEQEIAGYRDVLNIEYAIMRRFRVRPTFGQACTVDGEIEGKMSEDDYHPYYFGAVQMTCTVPNPTPESDPEIKEMI